MRSKVLAVALLAVAVFGLAAADEPLTRIELAKRGKAATALVLLETSVVSGGPHASGTAFVVHPDGLLVTNAHAVTPALVNRPVGRVWVVFGAGTPAQKLEAARVVRVDND